MLFFRRLSLPLLTSPLARACATKFVAMSLCECSNPCSLKKPLLALASFSTRASTAPICSRLKKTYVLAPQRKVRACQQALDPANVRQTRSPVVTRFLAISASEETREARHPKQRIATRWKMRPVLNVQSWTRSCFLRSQCRNRRVHFLVAELRNPAGSVCHGNGLALFHSVSLCVRRLSIQTFRLFLSSLRRFVTSHHGCPKLNGVYVASSANSTCGTNLFYPIDRCDTLLACARDYPFSVREQELCAQQRCSTAMLSRVGLNNRKM